MNFADIQRATNQYAPILRLERVISHTWRRRLLAALLYVLGVLLFLSLGWVMPVGPRITGSILLVSAVWLIIFAAEAFYYSYYFRSVRSLLERPNKKEVTVSFELAESLYDARENFITQSFLDSRIGREVCARVGLATSDIDTFFKNRKNPLTKERLQITDDDGVVHLYEFAQELLRIDTEFSDFLLTKKISEKDLVGAARWVESMSQKRKQQERWWSRDALARVPGIGKKWAYGEAYTFKRFALPIEEHSTMFSKGAADTLYRDEVDDLEAILARSYESNAILIAESGAPKFDVLLALNHRISTGEVLAPIEHKEMYVLESESLFNAAHDKKGFETLLTQVLLEAKSAGNILVVIDDLPSFVAGAASLGADVAGIIGPIVTHADIQVIATADEYGFERIIRIKPQLSELFEIVRMKAIETDIIVRYLEGVIPGIESNSGLWFTYQAVATIVTAIERYYLEENVEEKIRDLVSEILPRMQQKGEKIVTAEDIEQIVSSKTGVPFGNAVGSERDLLAHLEDALATRVVGQTEALQSLSDALRRARSGVSNVKRPMGSFLFIGPTGVGKTETSKAIAEKFFGDESRLMRLDMSEYNTPDALERLIGTVAGEPGKLTSMIRQFQYGVLLLDEFEKTESRVLDLFLQILDEGVFSDSLGKKVNARNILFIATSNAGSDLIWEIMRRGGASIYDKKDTIVNHIVRQRLFRPELLNRFDGIILFHPLQRSELVRIAELMLNKLAKRLRDQHIKLVINRELIERLADVGSDPEFGARPLNRAIQDYIEATVAERLVLGQIKAGDSVEFTAADLDKIIQKKR